MNDRRQTHRSEGEGLAGGASRRSSRTTRRRRTSCRGTASEVARARQFLIDKDVVTFPPGDDCEVIETPPFLRSTITAAYEPPPPFDPVTHGFFFVTPVDMTASPQRNRRRCCARTTTATKSTR